MGDRQKLTDYYSILGVDTDSTFDEIRKAYKKMVLIYHPDINKANDATEKFKEILRSYSVLKDPELRKQYDGELLKNNLVFPLRNLKHEYRKMKEKTVAFLQKAKIVFKNISSENRSRIFDDESAVDIFDELNEMDVYDLEEKLRFSGNAFVRYNAALALGYKKNKSSLHVLESSLNDRSSLVRKGVIFALGEIGMKKSLHMLKMAYNSAEPELKTGIIRAVFKITGKNSLIFNSLLLRGINDVSEPVRAGSLKLFLSINDGVSYGNIKDTLDKMSVKIKENSEKMLYAM
jgi:curved DNA-binding protein CbpA